MAARWATLADDRPSVSLESAIGVCAVAGLFHLDCGSVWAGLQSTCHLWAGDLSWNDGFNISLAKPQCALEVAHC